MLALQLCVALSIGIAPSFEGEFYDPDELQIRVQRTGNRLVAHSVDWEIAGSVTSETRARLAGLEGVLDADGITWSNGVKWTRKQRAEPVARRVRRELQRRQGIRLEGRERGPRLG